MWEMRNLDLHAEIVEIRMNGMEAFVWMTTHNDLLVHIVNPNLLELSF